MAWTRDANHAQLGQVFPHSHISCNAVLFIRRNVLHCLRLGWHSRKLVSINIHVRLPILNHKLRLVNLVLEL